ncbi:hypothetical protein [Oryza sativa Japonica Group]|uniref:Uncharacterized protein n=1 Tax=Oryza sativa subsp. japonica TaxID=39947 RepID=Q94CZ8_ORYSJ|nr:hypothetical protein [Oryza sativa Japonica Group]
MRFRDHFLDRDNHLRGFAERPEQEEHDRRLAAALVAITATGRRREAVVTGGDTQCCRDALGNFYGERIPYAWHSRCARRSL